MTPGDSHRVDRLGAQFVGNLPQLAFLQLAEIVRGFDLIKEGRLGRLSHQILHDNY
jgi:hypothetical protein